jgi:hypothetical protein
MHLRSGITCTSELIPASVLIATIYACNHICLCEDIIYLLHETHILTYKYTYMPQVRACLAEKPDSLSKYGDFALKNYLEVCARMIKLRVQWNTYVYLFFNVCVCIINVCVRVISFNVCVCVCIYHGEFVRNISFINKRIRGICTCGGKAFPTDMRARVCAGCTFV